MRLWDTHIEPEALQQIALSLKARMCSGLSARRRAAGQEGVGERLTPLSGFPVLDAVLVNPGVAVSTADVFGRLDIRTGITHSIAPHDWSLLLGFLEQQHNDLEEPASRAAPIIREAIDALCVDPLSLLVRLSGSGATCFGIFGDASCANDAARAITKAHPDWWVKVVKLQFILPCDSGEGVNRAISADDGEVWVPTAKLCGVAPSTARRGPPPPVNGGG